MPSFANYYRFLFHDNFVDNVRGEKECIQLANCSYITIAYLLGRIHGFVYWIYKGLSTTKSIISFFLHDQEEEHDDLGEILSTAGVDQIHQLVSRYVFYKPIPKYLQRILNT